MTGLILLFFIIIIIQTWSIYCRDFDQQQILLTMTAARRRMVVRREKCWEVCVCVVTAQERD